MESHAAASDLDTHPEHGLAEAEAARRLAEHGPNAIQEARERPWWRLLLDQFSDFLILVLLVAAVISGMVGEAVDTIAILVIVVLNAVIGFIQEFRAQKAIAALKKMAAASATVVRDGEVRAVPASDLAPGDVVLLEAGNVVPADLRLVEAARLRVEEAALTGESVGVDKVIEPLHEEDLAIGDRRNMAFKGTTVSYGRGRGLVIATGMDTELGRIAGMLAGDEDLKTPLQRRLARFGTHLALAVLGICAIVLTAGLARGEPPVLMFLTAVSLAVAAIPEALPAVVTIALALGARRMVRHHALIRRLPAVETLGSVTVICSDKTGTLTQNRMHVEELRAEDITVEKLDAERAAAGPWAHMARALVLCNDVMVDRRGHMTGDPTEVALAVAARNAGLARAEAERDLPRVAELPFDSSRKLMTTFHRSGERVIAYTKGAPEQLLPRCAREATGEGARPVRDAAWLVEAEAMAQRGLRVMALAMREWKALPEGGPQPEDAEQELVLIGLVGMMDPPRPEAARAVALCRSAGILPIMITGDHPATARAIARRLDIIGERDKVMTGRELARVPLERLEQEVHEIRVYARVDPEQKIKLVTALQARGEVVAMTGDGVNDAPALKQADIGVAMGKVGTDVAREASSMVLLDDNFATIVAAVKEGRRIYDNIRKFIKYTMTSNSGEIWVIFLAPFIGLPIPLLPIHILWINLVTDGLPGLALSVEPAERGVMKRAPRPQGESVFAHGMWQHIIWVGLLMGGVSLLLQAWAYHSETAHWQSMVFTVLTLSQLGHALAVRSETESLFRLGLLSNRPMLGAILVTFALQMAVLYVPYLNPVFKTEPLPLDDLAICLALSAVVFFAVEVEKWLVRRGVIYREASPATTRA